MTNLGGVDFQERQFVDVVTKKKRWCYRWWFWRCNIIWLECC